MDGNDLDFWRNFDELESQPSTSSTAFVPKPSASGSGDGVKRTRKRKLLILDNHKLGYTTIQDNCCQTEEEPIPIEDREEPVVHNQCPICLVPYTTDSSNGEEAELAGGSEIGGSVINAGICGHTWYYNAIQTIYTKFNLQ